MQLKQAIDEFSKWRQYKVGASTVKGYDQVLKSFCVFMRNTELEQITLDDILKWFDLLKQMDYERNSFVPKAMALKKFFEFYKKQGWPVLDPWLIPVPPKEYKIPRVANEADYQKLLSVIPVKTNDPRHIRNRAIVMMLWDTGARNGELLNLDMDDINLETMSAVIRTEKNKGSRPFRQIFWTNDTNEALKVWIKKRRDLGLKKKFHDPDALFLSAVSHQVGRRFTIKGVGEMLRRYSNRACINYLNAHSFRHAFGHAVVKNGGTTSDVANLLGHTSLNSSMVYTTMFGNELKERYNVIRQQNSFVKKQKAVVHRVRV